MGKAFTTEEFIHRARSIHGDKYDYSLVKYVNKRTPIKIICPIHGVFEQNPENHLRGGCWKCAKELNRKIITFTPLSGENWKDIKGWEGIYKISDKGRLMSKGSSNWHLMSLVNKKGDYFSVVLDDGVKKESYRIHVLVYKTFVGDIPKGRKFIVHHKDHNKQNNCVENLEVLTMQEHAIEHYVDNVKKIHGDDFFSNDTYLEHSKYIVEGNKVIGRSPFEKKERERIREKKKRIERGESKKPRCTKVDQYSLDGSFIKSFNSAEDAHKETHVCARNILQVANKTPFDSKGHVRKQAGGYIWRLAI